jgi:hypothetical protein
MTGLWSDETPTANLEVVTARFCGHAKVHKYELSVYDEPAEVPALPRNSPRHPTRERTPSDAESAVRPTSGRSQITNEED